jgi:hypothetical protein
VGTQVRCPSSDGMSGNKLTFTTISDRWADRRDILTYGPWTGDL